MVSSLLSRHPPIRLQMPHLRLTPFRPSQVRSPLRVRIAGPTGPATAWAGSQRSVPPSGVLPERAVRTRHRVPILSSYIAQTLHSLFANCERTENVLNTQDLLILLRLLHSGYTSHAQLSGSLGMNDSRRPESSRVTSPPSGQLSARFSTTVSPISSPPTGQTHPRHADRLRHAATDPYRSGQATHPPSGLIPKGPSVVRLWPPSTTRCPSPSAKTRPSTNGSRWSMPCGAEAPADASEPASFCTSACRSRSCHEQRSEHRAAHRDRVRRLGPLAEQMVFVGGSTTALFITDAAATDVRETLRSPDLPVDLLPTLSSMRTPPRTRYVESAVAGGRPLDSQNPVSSAEIERPERCMTVSD